MILVTGGAGFIGANFVLDWLAAGGEPVVNLDKLTYAGNLGNLASLSRDPRHIFVRGDIGDRALVAALLAEHRPRAIVNFAAESHVDRSIHGPADFIATNVVGTFSLLETVREWWSALADGERRAFRFLHVSTDEVFGSLGAGDPAFSETTAYAPNSPYSASKAASDHLVRAWHHTYGLPVVTTNCSNNYGPRQFPEKLIPLMIVNALAGKPLPVYGDGGQTARLALSSAITVRRSARSWRKGVRARPTPSAAMPRWRISSSCARSATSSPSCGRGATTRRRSAFVTDRPGHDRRYAIDATKIRQELRWTPKETFATGMRRTVQWYLDNGDWLASVTSGEYQKWIAQNYATAPAA